MPRVENGKPIQHVLHTRPRSCTLCSRSPRYLTRPKLPARWRQRNVSCSPRRRWVWHRPPSTRRCGVFKPWYVSLSRMKRPSDLSKLQMTWYLDLSDREPSHRKSSQAWTCLGLAIRLAHGVSQQGGADCELDRYSLMTRQQIGLRESRRPR